MSTPTIQATATKEQVLYADILAKGMYVGLLLLFITFALYAFGIMTPVVPLSEISNYWTTSAHEYLEAINHNFLHWDHLPLGWAWFSLLGKGDFLNFLPIAILSGVTIACYLAIVPGLFRRGDTAYAIMAILEAVILAAAASGLLAVGH